MAKPVAPKMEKVPSQDIQQIGRLQAEIEGLGQLAKRDAISQADADDQIKQRQRAQVLLCKKTVDTPTLVLSAEEKRAAFTKATRMIETLNNTKKDLEEARKKASPSEASALEADLTRVGADLAILEKAKDMLAKDAA